MELGGRVLAALSRQMAVALRWSSAQAKAEGRNRLQSLPEIGNLRPLAKGKRLVCRDLQPAQAGLVTFNQAAARALRPPTGNF